MAIIVSAVFRFVLGKPVDRGGGCPAGRLSWPPLPGIGARFAWPERQDLMILTGLARGFGFHRSSRREILVRSEYSFSRQTPLAAQCGSAPPMRAEHGLWQGRTSVH